MGCLCLFARTGPVFMAEAGFFRRHRRCAALLWVTYAVAHGAVRKMCEAAGLGNRKCRVGVALHLTTFFRQSLPQLSPWLGAWPPKGARCARNRAGSASLPFVCICATGPFLTGRRPLFGDTADGWPSALVLIELSSVSVTGITSRAPARH